MADDETDGVRRYHALYEHGAIQAIRRLDLPADNWKTILNTREGHDDVVSLNRHLPSVILARLARCGSERARMDVAAKHATPPSLLRMLADDESSAVRREVALNDHCPSDVRQRLTHDDRDFVAESARERIDSA